LVPWVLQQQVGLLQRTDLNKWEKIWAEFSTLAVDVLVYVLNYIHNNTAKLKVDNSA
jgi:hypothetical protein